MEQWRQVLPEKISGTAAQFNPELIWEVAVVANKLTDNEDAENMPFIAHNGPAVQCVVTWRRLPMTFAIVMPWQKRAGAVARLGARQQQGDPGRGGMTS